MVKNLPLTHQFKLLATEFVNVYVMLMPYYFRNQLKICLQPDLFHTLHKKDARELGHLVSQFNYQSLKMSLK